MINCSPLSKLVLLGFLLPCVELRAEVFVLANGGRIEGEWLNRDNEPHLMYEVETATGGRITLSSSQVDRVIVKSEALLRYEAELPKVLDTKDGHWAMAERCRKAGLKAQRELHLRKVLEFDPNHEDARRALGYSRVDGEWIKADEWLAKQGYVRHKGSWRLPQEVELDARQERQTLEEKEWRKRLRVWRSSIARGRNDSAEALAQIQAVDSAYAIAGLSEMLSDKDESKPLKLVYIDVLGKFTNSNAATALLERVMKDPDLEIRERAIDALKKNSTAQAVAVLSRGLGNRDNNIVNQVGWALGQLGDPAAIPALIEAVVTKHKFKVSGGGAPGGLNAGFSPSGGTSFQSGGRPRIIERDLPNRQVLFALTSLTSEGINFAYDKQAWKNWWAQRQFHPDVNLRRDE